jgi:ParB family chromosome partitioning protein
MTQIFNNSIFWVETDKIRPNPYQPRKEFDERALVDLADSIRQYGVLQPLVVTRHEVELPDGQGLSVQYELIAGERRLRASRIAGLPQVPVIIRSGTEDAKTKLELAIIENLQREDLNPIDRARAFMQLHTEFGFTHAEIGKKNGQVT